MSTRREYEERRRLTRLELTKNIGDRIVVNACDFEGVHYPATNGTIIDIDLYWRVYTVCCDSPPDDSELSVDENGDFVPFF